MMAFATCTLSVFRGEATDEYGDDIEVNTTPVATRVPASVVARSKVVTTYEQETPRVIRWYVGRVEQGTDIRKNDRLRNEQTGHVYFVDAVGDSGTGAVPTDLVLDLRRQP